MGLDIDIHSGIFHFFVFLSLLGLNLQPRQATALTGVQWRRMSDGLIHLLWSKMGSIEQNTSIRFIYLKF